MVAAARTKFVSGDPNHRRERAFKFSATDAASTATATAVLALVLSVSAIVALAVVVIGATAHSGGSPPFRLAVCLDSI